MNIGIDARMIDATGIGRYTRNLIENLEKIDKDNSYFIFLKKDDYEKINFGNQNFIKVLADFHWYGLSEQVKFPKLIKKNKIDLMHFPHFNVPIFYNGKFVVTIHDLTLHKHKTVKASTKGALVYQFKHFLYKIIFRSAIKKAKYIFTLSEFTKDDVLNNFRVDKNKFFVTLAGAPEKKDDLYLDINIKTKFKIKDKFILYVGNAYPHKNLGIFINIAKKLNNDISIVLAGKKDYFYNTLEKEINNNNLQNKIIITDYVNDKELSWLYKNAQVFVFPSFNEGFGLPLLEAASFGAPIATSNAASLPEVIGDAALYFDPKSSEQALEKINKIINNKDLRRNLVVRGYDRIKMFSWRKMAEQTLDIYNKTLKQ